MSFCRLRVGSLATVVALGLFTLLALGCEPEQGPGTIHPVEERVPHYYETDHTIETGPSPEDGLPAQLSEAGASPALTLGVQDGSGPELFGRIRDVAADADGRIHILDYENKESRVFGPAGAHLYSFGREGEGPGEFQYPSQLARFEDGSLMVAGRSGRVQLFDILAETYERMGGFTVEFTPEDACVLDDKIYLHGALAEQSDHSIHAYSREGMHKRSFGPVYQSENEFIRQSISDGTMACDRSTGTVVFGFTYAPLLYGYTATGEHRWTSRIRSFEPMPVEQYVSDRGTPGVRYGYDAGTHRIAEIVDRPGAGVVVQTAEYPPEEADRADTSLYTYLVSADGTGAYAGKTAAAGEGIGFISQVTSRRVFSVVPVPFPTVDVYDVTGVEWTLGGTVEE